MIDSRANLHIHADELFRLHLQAFPRQRNEEVIQVVSTEGEVADANHQMLSRDGDIRLRPIAPNLRHNTRERRKPKPP